MAILIDSKTAASDKNKWATLWECYQDASHLFELYTGKSFVIDVAAEPQTTKLPRFYASPDWIAEQKGDYSSLSKAQSHWNELGHELTLEGFDSLQCNWPDGWWCNPPFDRKFEFIDKAVIEALKGREGMMLIPYEPLTGWWIEHVEGKASMVFEPDGRYQFYEADGKTKKGGANFGSCLVLFTKHGVETPRRRIKRGIGSDSQHKNIINAA